MRFLLSIYLIKYIYLSATIPKTRVSRSIVINEVIINSFKNYSPNDRTNIPTLKSYIEENSDGLNQINVITLMHRCGKYKSDIFSFIPLSRLLELLSINYSRASAQGIANALYGLQAIDENTADVDDVLNVLSDQLQSCTEAFKAQAISNALYGLQNFNSDSAAVRRLLSLINTKIRANMYTMSERGVTYKGLGDSGLSAQGLGSAFLGLRGMDSACVEVNELLLTLSECLTLSTTRDHNKSNSSPSQKSSTVGLNYDRIATVPHSYSTSGLKLSRDQSSDMPLDSQAVANILEGLKSSSSLYSGPRKVLSAVAVGLQKYPSCLDGMSPRELAMTIHGLQGISSDSHQVRAFIDALANSLEGSLGSTSGPPSSPHIRAQDQGSETAENDPQNTSSEQTSASVPTSVQMPLWAFLRADEFESMLLGMRRLSSDHACVRRLLSVIVRAVLGAELEWRSVWKSKAKTSSQDTSGRFKDSKANVRAQSVKGAVHGSNRAFESRSRPLDGFDGKAVGTALYGLQGMDSAHVEVRAMIGLIAWKLSSSTTKLALSGRELSAALYGLQSCTGDSKEVQLLLSGLSAAAHENARIRPEEDARSYNGRHLSMALYGLRRMRCMTKQESKLVDCLAEKIKASINLIMEINASDKETNKVYWSRSEEEFDWSFSGTELAAAVYGLQSIRERHISVRRLLYALAQRISIASDSLPQTSTLDARGVGMVLHGVRDLRPRFGAVSVFHGCLADEIDKCREAVQGRNLVTAIRGLRSISSKHLRRVANYANPMDPLEMVTEESERGVGFDDDLSIPPPHSSTMLLSDCSDDEEMEGPGNWNWSGSGSGMSFIDLDGNACKGMGTRKLLFAVAGLCRKRTDHLTASEACNSLYGLQGLSLCESDQEAEAIRNIVERIEQDLAIAANKAEEVLGSGTARKSNNTQSFEINSHNLANAMYGLQSLSSVSPSEDPPELVRSILRSLTVLLKASPNLHLTPTAVGNAFYGLQSLSSEVDEVANFIGALADKMSKMPRSKQTVHTNARHAYPSVYQEDPPDSAVDAAGHATIHLELNADCERHSTLAGSDEDTELSGQHIGNALWGLRRCTSHRSEVRRALSELASLLKGSSAELSGQNVAISLFGMQGMSCEHEEVRAVLAAMVPKVFASSHPFSSQDVGMALYGLRNMDSASVEIRALLGLLLHKLRKSPTRMGAADLSRAIIGILRAEPWIRDDFLCTLQSRYGSLNVVPVERDHVSDENDN